MAVAAAGRCLGVSAALVAACPLLLLDMVGRLLPGLGLPFHPVAFVSRGRAWLAASWWARPPWPTSDAGAAPACPAAGPTHDRGRRGPLGGPGGRPDVAVGGWLVRLFAQLAVGLDRSPLQEGGSLLVFEVGFVLAGTVLPLALVHPWGRVLPRWVPPLAGRRVPGWLLLGPGVRHCGGLTIYFGVGTAQLAVETLGGTWTQAPVLCPWRSSGSPCPPTWSGVSGLGPPRSPTAGPPAPRAGCAAVSPVLRGARTRAAGDRRPTAALAAEGTSRTFRRLLRACASRWPGRRRVQGPGTRSEA